MRRELNNKRERRGGENWNLNLNIVASNLSSIISVQN